MVLLTMPQSSKVSPTNTPNNDDDDTLGKLEKFVTNNDKSQDTPEPKEKEPDTPKSTNTKEPVTEDDTLDKLEQFVTSNDKTEETSQQEEKTELVETASTDEEEEEEPVVVETMSKYEELLKAMPLSGEDAKIVLAGGQLGLLHEVLALRAIQYCRSPPLISYKSEKKNLECQRSYYPEAEIDDAKSVIISNLSAYMYWDYAWNYHRRHVIRRRFENLALRDLDSSQDCRIWRWTPEVIKVHTEWCQRRDINPASVRAISEVIDHTMAVLFQARFEPEWLKCTDPTPVWRRFGAWKGDWERDDHYMIGRVYGSYNAPLLCDTLRNLCDAGGDTRAVLMSALELVATSGDWRPCQVGVKGSPVDRVQQFIANNTRLAKFKAWNTIKVTRPSNKDFLQGTRAKGGNYVFMHDTDTVGVGTPQKKSEKSTSEGFDAIAPLLPGPVLHGGAYSWFMRKAEHLVLIGEGDFSFSEALVSLGHPAFISSTNDKTAPPRRARRSLLKRVLADSKRVTSLDATRVHRYGRIQTRVESGDARSFAWNFPFNDKNQDDSSQEVMIQSTFSSLATLYDQSMDYDFPVVALHPFLFGLTLHDDQFSRWFVLRAALRTGWRLRSWCSFDHTAFPGYQPCRKDGQPLNVKNARFYVFQYMYCNVL